MFIYLYMHGFLLFKISKKNLKTIPMPPTGFGVSPQPLFTGRSLCGTAMVTIGWGSRFIVPHVYGVTGCDLAFEEIHPPCLWHGRHFQHFLSSESQVVVVNMG